MLRFRKSWWFIADIAEFALCIALVTSPTYAMQAAWLFGGIGIAAWRKFYAEV